MKSVLMIMWMFGYGAGYEGYDNGKIYVGTYTPTCEYGWVVTNKEIYLDTIYKKRFDK